VGPAVARCSAVVVAFGISQLVFSEVGNLKPTSEVGNLKPTSEVANLAVA